MKKNQTRQHPRVDVRRHIGRWISLHPVTRRIVTNSVSLKKAGAVALRIGIERPLLMMVSESEGFFVGMG